MYVYRMEHKVDGEGPYRTDRKDGSVSLSLYNEHPTPEQDGLDTVKVVYCWDRDFYFAFAYKNQLKKWFYIRKYNIKLYKHYHIVKYKVKKSDVLFCNLQVAFNRKKSERISHETIFDFFGYSK